MSTHSARSLERELEQLFAKQKTTVEASGAPVALRGRRNRAERNLEDALASALLAGDRELGNIIRELEEISSALREAKSSKEAHRVASHPAVWHAVKHELVERELRHLALSDDLTCLYNRRGFYAAATQQLKSARRNQKSAALFFCDLDELKAINDTYGHREGDLALVRTADALEEVFRESDVLARLGGDEFAVLAADLLPDHERMILNRLHESVRAAGKDERRYTLSVSVGAAWFDPRNPVTLGELMEEADRAMYGEKRKRFALPQKERAKLHPINNGGGTLDAVVFAKRKI
jgi:diguanylate cyclase (GGDEF)-like protein